MTQVSLLDEAMWGDEYDAESDLAPIRDHRAVVTGTDWTVETILSQMKRGNIDLSPRFQRRDAWDSTRKSRFIESLILQLPIPQIVLAEKKEKRGQFIVLDGKQRLLAIRQFAMGSSVESGADDFRPLKLSGLDMRPDLTGKMLKDLENSVQLSDDLNAFLNQTIRTVVVRSWPDEDFLNLVFLRLNTGSVGLSPQELRQALAPGPFTDFLDEYASSSVPMRSALHIERPDFRMRDVEIALRFFAFDFLLGAYQGNLKKFLDDATEKLNRIWSKDPTSIIRASETLDLALQATIAIFEDDAFRRWAGDGFNKPFNRAVFDIMTFFFKEVDIRNAALAKPEEVKDAFKGLCEKDQQFVDSIQSTTKTLQATKTRLLKWGKVLEQVLGLRITKLEKIESLAKPER